MKTLISSLCLCFVCARRHGHAPVTWALHTYTRPRAYPSQFLSFLYMLTGLITGTQARHIFIESSNLPSSQSRRHKVRTYHFGLWIYRLLNISRPRCVDGWRTTCHCTLLHSTFAPISHYVVVAGMTRKGWKKVQRRLNISMIDHAVRRMDLIGLRSKGFPYSSSLDGWKEGGFDFESG